jgi:hypothetical protein
MTILESIDVETGARQSPSGAARLLLVALLSAALFVAAVKLVALDAAQRVAEPEAVAPSEPDIVATFEQAILTVHDEWAADESATGMRPDGAH